MIVMKYIDQRLTHWETQNLKIVSGPDPFGIRSLWDTIPFALGVTNWVSFLMLRCVGAFDQHKYSLIF